MAKTDETPQGCPCGSGKIPESLVDGYGIYMCQVCDDCRERQIAKYRPDIFEHYECDEPIEPED